MRKLLGKFVEWALGYRHTVKYIKQDSASVPTRAYRGDAGYDLYCSEETWIPPGQCRNVPCSIKFRLPEGMWLMLLPRSSAMRKRGILVVSAVIDQGYVGDMFVAALNTNPESVKVSPGERLAQAVPFRLLNLSFEPALTMGSTERGEGGFGSSGV